MNESTTNLTAHFTGRASLAVLGVKIRKMDLLAPVRKLVHIPQKTVKDAPFEKLFDAFITVGDPANAFCLHCRHRQADGANSERNLSPP